VRGKIRFQQIPRLSIASAAAILGVAGAIMVSANIGVSSLGFLIMCLCNALWMHEGRRTSQPALVMMNIAFLAINALGAFRYL
jgi:hypothetical protein